MSRPPAPRKGLLHVRSGQKSGGIGARKPGVASSSSSGSAAVGSRSGPAAKGGDEGFLYLAGVRDASKRVTEYSSEKDTCPVCHTDRQFNPSLRLLVSPCYHRMCESCIDRLFTLGPEPCPSCGRLLRKTNFQHQTFEDLRVEREVSVRRRMADYFNKREQDFDSAREYDDYLEKVEEWTFNLLNEVDVDATERAIATYRNLNAPQIAANKERSALEALTQAERDDVDRRAREERMRMVEEAERVERAEDERVRVEIVDALAKGHQTRAGEIRAAHERDKAGRAANLAKALPSLGRAGRGEGQGEGGEGEEENTTDPLGVDYVGAYVPMPYASADELLYRRWYEIKDDYVDGRAKVVRVKLDEKGDLRGGGWKLGAFWEQEIESAVMSLGTEPLR